MGYMVLHGFIYISLEISVFQPTNSDMKKAKK